MTTPEDQNVPATTSSQEDAPRDVIEPAPVGVTAIVGHSRIGRVGEALRFGTESDFNRELGDFDEAPILAAAIHGFFQNGGRECVVINLGEQPRGLVPKDLKPLEAETDIELVCAPGKTEATDYQALIQHCVANQTRLALLDGPQDLSRHMIRLRPPASSHAALYVPWLMVQNPALARVVPVPPSAFMAGLMARVAHDRGAHKAPANEPIFGISGLADEIDKAQQDILHPRKVNCIRRVPHLEGIRPWGAQTTAPVGPFLSIAGFRFHSFIVRSFLNVRRFLAGSPSDPDAWRRLEEAGAAFLNDLWQSGALVGETASEAYRIRCDAELNTPQYREQGVIMFELSLAVSRAGKFSTFEMGVDIS